MTGITLLEEGDWLADVVSADELLRLLDDRLRRRIFDHLSHRNFLLLSGTVAEMNGRFFALLDGDPDIRAALLASMVAKGGKVLAAEWILAPTDPVGIVIVLERAKAFGSPEVLAPPSALRAVLGATHAAAMPGRSVLVRQATLFLRQARFYRLPIGTRRDAVGLERAALALVETVSRPRG